MNSSSNLLLKPEISSLDDDMMELWFSDTVLENQKSPKSSNQTTPYYRPLTQSSIFYLSKIKFTEPLHIIYCPRTIKRLTKRIR